MRNNDAVIIPISEFNRTARLSIERILRTMVNVMPIYSDEAPSRRIEGQFGGEIMEEQFSEMFVYIQYSSQLAKSEIVKDIIFKFYNGCYSINKGSGLTNRIFLFNDVNNKIKLASRNLMRSQAFRSEALFSSMIKR